MASNAEIFPLDDVIMVLYFFEKNKANLIYLTQIGFKSSIFQLKLTVQKRSIRIKIGDLLSRVTLKFNGWPWKTIGHLFYVASSLMHYFVAIGQLKLKLQSGNAQFGSKLAILLSHKTLKFDGWPWKTMGHLFYATSSFVHHFVAIGEFKLEL